MISRQVAIVAVEPHTIVGREAFAIGIKHAIDGRPLLCPPGDIEGNREAFEWTYERGRHFATWCRVNGIDVPPNRIGRRINDVAVSLYQRARSDGSIL